MELEMPNQINVLIERLKQFDEVTLCELLDISSEDILERFRNKVVKRQKYLFGEVEILNIDDEDLEDEDEWDGFQLDKGDEDDNEE
ncbi:MAG: hypothetical protein ACREQ5_22520 [Candidatus Dormibacteria bacterium]